MSQSHQHQLEQLKQQKQYRQLNQTLLNHGQSCEFNQKLMVNLSSNDYLGLNADRALKAQFLSTISADNFFASSTSSRLLTGNSPTYTQIEQLVAKQYQKDGALLFNSGYHANIGLLPAITTKNDLIVSDKFCHASLIDGIKLSPAKHLRFKHNDYMHLDYLLDKYRDQYEHVFIVTESLFSMDGDIADLNQLAKLKLHYQAFLYVDEAHAVGCYGCNGLGLSEYSNTIQSIDFIVCPMGKAIASIGAYVALNNPFYELLINRARSLIYTTALPEINLKWSLFILGQMTKFTHQRQQLRHLINIASEQLVTHQLISDSNITGSHIIPIVLGDNNKAVALSDYLKSNHRLVFAIRPPTVPKNTARIRLSLSASLSEKSLTETIKMMAQFIHANH